MAKKHSPSSPVTRLLQQHGAIFSVYAYKYSPKGGTACSAKELGIDEHQVIKTLVMEDEDGTPCIILMHGDCSVSTRKLARAIGCKTISPCKPEVAQRHTGYMVGGTSPFATRKKLPLYAEASIMELEQIYINAGRRGLLVCIAPRLLTSILNPTLVHAAT
ncbi:MAG: aminoacyl-tRNA deacylase [Desulfuromonadaceae bacterium]|nr:aminoacyl-tRNA deacylase [Desulfuromonadaceae bacterium]